MSGDFDKAIDRAVREMLDVDPPAGLGARVMRRIAEKDRVSRKRIILWTAVPLGAAAALVLALLPLRTVDRHAQPSATIATVDSPRTPSPGATPAVGAPPQRPRTTATPAVAATARPRAIAAAERTIAAAAFTAAEPATELEPLKSITPIEVAPIADHRVAPAEISVRPLNPIVEVQIAPLNPSERRN